MRFWCLSIALMCLAVGCSGPKVVPQRQDPAFNLKMIQDAKVAVWPVVACDADESVSSTIAKEYETQNKFMDAFANKFSSSLLTVTKADSLPPEKIVSLFATKETREFLDPGKLVAESSTDTRFGLNNDVLTNYLDRLSQQGGLSGVQFLIVPNRIGLGRKWTYQNSGGGMYTGGPHGGAFIGGGSSSAETGAILKVIILDLPTKKLVWEGQVMAAASSSFMKATALHEVEDGLVANFLNAVKGQPE